MKSYFFTILLFVGMTLGALPGPENTAVVVNSDSWASTCIANEFIWLRKIPPENVIFLSGLEDFNQVTADYFRSNILIPVFKTLSERKIINQIDCIAYSSDIPVCIDAREDLKEKDLELTMIGHAVDENSEAGKDQREYLKIFTPYLSSNSATYLYRLFLNKDINYFGLAINFYALRQKPNAGTDKSENEGKLTDEAKGKLRGFTSRIAWTQTGEPLSIDQLQANTPVLPYMLSIVLGCSSGEGNSVPEIISSMRRSVAADGSAPDGTIYLMKSGDAARSGTREWGFDKTCEKLQELEVDAEVIEDKVLPDDKTDVMGMMTGTANFAWKNSGSELLPGSICDNLTSFGGSMAEGNEQTPLTEFIRYGAAGSSGTVFEPYAVQAKFATPFIFAYYASGSSLVESYYQSVTGPYQLLIVGDPLCRPWAKNIKFDIVSPKDRAALEGMTELDIVISNRNKYPPSFFLLYVDGKFCGTFPLGQKCRFDASKLPEGFHKLTVSAASEDLVAFGSRTITFETGKALASFNVTTRVVVRWNEKMQLRASFENAEKIIFMCNGKNIAEINCGKGETSFPAASLGQGISTIQPVAVVKSGEASRLVTGAPFSIAVIPPEALEPQNIGREFDSLPEGFVIISQDGKKTVIADKKSDCFESAEIKVGEKFKLQAVFAVPTDDVYQFQVNGNTGIERIAVDGEKLEWTGKGSWFFYPVNLKKGVHKFDFEGSRLGEKPLDIRFGGPGTKKLSPKNFRNTET